MSSNNSQPNSGAHSKNIRHDLENLLGNLKAIEYLVFLPGNSGDREAYRKSYQDLLQRFEEILAEFKPVAEGTVTDQSRLKEHTSMELKV